jgi:flagellar hook-associated protein 3 FlgL
MDRVATFMQSQTMLGSLLRTQRNLFDAQTEVSTGKKINEFSDSPSQLGGLMAARNAASQAADYEASAKSVMQRLDLQDVHLGELADVASQLRQDVFDAIGNADGMTLRAKLKDALDRAVSMLNTQSDGKYIYGGTRQDVPPVVAKTLEDLAALPGAAGAFQNNAVAASAKVDTDQSIVFGQLADVLGAPLFDIIRQIAAFDSGPSGPLDGPLEETQIDFLSSLLAPLDTVSKGLIGKQAENGLASKTAESAAERHADAQVTYKTLVADIEEVDMAEAITRLNNAQIAMEASAKTFTAVQQLSLLDYLPV